MQRLWILLFFVGFAASCEYFDSMDIERNSLEYIVQSSDMTQATITIENYYRYDGDTSGDYGPAIYAPDGGDPNLPFSLSHDVDLMNNESYYMILNAEISGTGNIQVIIKNDGVVLCDQSASGLNAVVECSARIKH
ncbi:MAG: hypothetical protein CVV44_20425 [Spirochaetae bacterium HGW-Spirochaetae-1]|jgi:hypothetical protein|nr:MAG: hypothetical protein CVV44_20425 [Spirochaetae bacterium HGW-Spirochaetae-1]